MFTPIGGKSGITRKVAQVGSWAGGMLKDPKRAKPMTNPQADMRTWKPPKKAVPKSSGTKLTPKQRSRIKNKKSYLA